mmetsp:Transcript_2853/g.4666  ORF Transcript_2853/g.4666 Transcript_2853/m.4666 type:complete len:226 (+) Transcript_2853:183-860(+)
MCMQAERLASRSVMAGVWTCFFARGRRRRARPRIPRWPRVGGKRLGASWSGRGRQLHARLSFCLSSLTSSEDTEDASFPLGLGGQFDRGGWPAFFSGLRYQAIFVPMNGSRRQTSFHFLQPVGLYTGSRGSLWISSQLNVSGSGHLPLRLFSLMYLSSCDMCTTRKPFWERKVGSPNMKTTMFMDSVPVSPSTHTTAFVSVMAMMTTRVPRTALTMFLTKSHSSC